MNADLTLEEKATNSDTRKHIARVSELLSLFAKQLLDRAVLHDRSKLGSPEVEEFTRHTAHLAATTFGSPEYNAAKKEMEPALQHHYAHNRHHPEHFKDGVADMNLVDLMEMLVDWKASSERHHNGNLRKSIEINANRFGLPPMLTKIMENTVELLETPPL